MPTIVPGDLPWRPAQRAILPLAEAAEPVTKEISGKLPLSLLEAGRRLLVTFLRTDQLDINAPRGLLRGLFRRRFESLSIRATGLPLAGGKAQADQVNVQLSNVRLSLSLRGPVFRIGSVRFRATINQAQLNKLVTLPTGVDRLSITPNGFTFHTFTGLPVFTTVELKGKQLVVAPTTPVPIPWMPKFGLNFDLPDLPAGARFDQLALYDGLLIAAGSVRTTDEVQAERAEAESAADEAPTAG